MADTHDEEVAGEDRRHAPILFNAAEAEAEHQSALQEERDKHRRRAEKFGTQYKDPGRVRKDFKLMMEARQERLKANHGFTTGNIDLFSEEEQQKRAARASRFQLAEPRAPALDRYRPDEELEARARRAAKFGVPYQPTEAVLMDMDLFEQRREVGSHVERRPEAIYLYGVDVMGTRDVLSYFGDYGATFVEWLDDSSCNVLFPDVNSTKRALVGRGTPLPPEVVTQPQSEEAAAAEAAAMAAAVRPGDPVPPPPAVRYQPELPVPDNLADVANIPYVWVKGEDFMKNGTPVSLVYRMATVVDVRDMAAPKRTRELWKSGGAGGGGGGEGRGRGGRGGRGGKRRFQRGDGDDMDVDEEEGPGDTMEHDAEEEDRGAKRQRGARGGQRHVVKAARQVLRPYGGLDLMAGPAPLPAGGHVLDYTELEDEAPATEPDPAVVGGAGAQRAAEGAEGGEGDADAEGGAGRGSGWRGRGRGGRGRGGRGRGGEGMGYVDLDLRQVLKARRRAEMEARQARARSRSPGAEGGGDDEAGDGRDE
ncbi:hypothetical protein HYH02_003899 [Chlamydomonas schloesseri]|uniref:Nuclear cap-binding protein subunit 3 n=1 Tax=Chlamydomonas schloesseri TaxID=2026947 RepID=A0A835WQ53_9CHLO|nr:hypothetical protein HYH02_003899 [Chlamydomonas schloesseri]|eukprot:KAG2451293.1 hypothetical protein HYH02_003899 [Chlamydomonas schloesseri]